MPPALAERREQILRFAQDDKGKTNPHLRSGNEYTAGMPPVLAARGVSQWGGASRRGSAALAWDQASDRGRIRPSRSPVRQRRRSHASAERRLLVPQGFDRVEARGLHGGIEAEEDADRERDHEADQDRPERGLGRERVEGLLDGGRDGDADADADRAAEKRQSRRLGQELQHDVAAEGAHRLAGGKLSIILSGVTMPKSSGLLKATWRRIRRTARALSMIRGTCSGV